MKIDRNRLIVISTFIVLIIWQIFEYRRTTANQELLNKSGIETSGVIKNFDTIGLANSTLSIEYEFNVDGSKFTGHQTFDEYCDFYYECYLSSSFQSKYVKGNLYCKVIYDSTNPNISKAILLDKYCKIK